MQDPTEGEYPGAIRLVLIANDQEYKVWSTEEVDRTRRTFIQRRGGVPTLEDLLSRFDNDKLHALLQHFVAEKSAADQLDRKLQSTGDPCHACGSTETPSEFDFGLARNHKTNRDWKTVGLSAAISAVTLPLLGTGALYGPAKSSTAQLLRLKLKLCPKCLSSRRGLFGGFTAKEADCQLHPLWKELYDAGFSKFVGPNDLKSWIQLPA